MLSFLLSALLFFTSIAAQETNVLVCGAGQCIQGSTNVTIGAKLAASGTTILLLPGQYTYNTGPDILHNALTTSGAVLTSSPGFTNSTTVTLPLNLTVLPGMTIYADSRYGGKASWAPLPSVPLTLITTISAGSIAIAPNLWVSAQVGSSQPFIIWDNIPDVGQLPSSIASTLFGIVDLQASSCTPPCSSNGICSSSGTCQCPTGFTGSSCESCAKGHYGPSCQACPAGCSKCDEGISGTGTCLALSPGASTCNCINGVCQKNGQCTCISGWTTASNGTSCAKCASGYYLSSTDGNCYVCGLGCSQCSDGNGICTTCQSGLTQDSGNRMNCILSTTNSIICPDGTFSNGTTCSPCSSSCYTCTGATSNNCIICASGTYKLNGVCVTTDGNGICAGSNMIADNVKHECDNCPVRCTSCKYPTFSGASIVNQLQCTGCASGYVLSKGQCVTSCPTGSFLSTADNMTCTACDASCTTCAGSSTYCLSCASGLASHGSCVTTCPSGTFSSSGACLPCHPDCATCSGGSFNQCSSCSSTRPVLISGRCLRTCSKAQYFDTATSACLPCDSSCSSCLGGGTGNCLACSNSNSVLQAGTCVKTNCSSSTVISNLGVCLSDLVLSPQASVSGSATGTVISPTTTTIHTTTKAALAWWGILLVVLGCVLIIIGLLMAWRWKVRRLRETKTKARAKDLRLKVGYDPGDYAYDEKPWARSNSQSPGVSDLGIPSTYASNKPSGYRKQPNYDHIAPPQKLAEYPRQQFPEHSRQQFSEHSRQQLPEHSRQPFPEYSRPDSTAYSHTATRVDEYDQPRKTHKMDNNGSDLAYKKRQSDDWDREYDTKQKNQETALVPSRSRGNPFDPPNVNVYASPYAEPQRYNMMPPPRVQLREIVIGGDHPDRPARPANPTNLESLQQFFLGSGVQ